MDLRELEPAAEWRAAQVADPEAWTLYLSDDDLKELDGLLERLQERLSVENRRAAE